MAQASRVPDEDLAIIGTTIKKLRGEQGRRVGDFAADVGISRRHLSYIEHGHGRASVAIYGRIAQALDVPLDRILGQRVGAA